jgi:processive 1,2-diacylglycerol beta-glucosyltransferase
MTKTPSVLILTAGFGDGHNSAARSVREALEVESGGAVRAVVVDLFADAAPVTGRFYKWFYAELSTNWPGLWRWVFEQSGKGNFASLWWDRFVGVGQALDRRIAEHQPDFVVLTYPVYPYFMSLRAAGGPLVFMAVTDSITIHPIWLHGKVDRLYVTDEFSREVAVAGLRYPITVAVSGFPVAPRFAGFPARGAEAAAGALKVLYFATTAGKHVRLTLRGLLENGPPGMVLTLVMGRHEARLRPVVQEVLEAFPGLSVRVVGWTSEVPAFLMENDVVITKAGGATVHECLAAGVPVIANYIIPGQEEGNVDLLERLGGGCRSRVPEETGALLAAAVRDGRLAGMRRAMAAHRRPDGALRIARDILAEISAGNSPGPGR